MVQPRFLTTAAHPPQVFEVATCIPGKALGAAIKALEDRLTEDAFVQLTVFHQKVVKYLQQSSRGEVEEGLAEELASQVPAVRAMLAGDECLQRN